MILIIDDNEERGKNTCIWLRVKGYIVSHIGYENMKYYTKPFMTVYINPPHKFIDEIKNEETISIIFTERKSVTIPQWCIGILSLKNIANEVERIYLEKCPYNKDDKVDVLGYACMKNSLFGLGGEVFKLSNNQKQLIQLFMYNYPKKFNLYDAIGYFRLLNNSETKLINRIYSLNRKAKCRNREKIIVLENDVCYFNPQIANYVCQEEDFTIKELENSKEFYYKNFTNQN